MCVGLARLPSFNSVPAASREATTSRHSPFPIRCHAASTTCLGRRSCMQRPPITSSSWCGLAMKQCSLASTDAVSAWEGCAGGLVRMPWLLLFPCRAALAAFGTVHILFQPRSCMTVVQRIPNAGALLSPDSLAELI